MKGNFGGLVKLLNVTAKILQGGCHQSILDKSTG